MRNLLLLLLALNLPACASLKPKFQKGPGGYQVADVSPPDAFVVTVDLMKKVDDKYAETYGLRAVAEECLSRGYDYFDFAAREPRVIEGYCYKTPDHPGLGVEFALKGLAETPQRFLVGDLNGKTKTGLEKGDELLEIDGQPPVIIANIKSHVFRDSVAKQKTIPLKVKRGDQTLEIKEPIALFKNSSMGSAQLELLRSRTD
jgi:hypothetical protein